MDKNKNAGNEMEEKCCYVMTEQWDSALIIIVRQTQNAESTDFTWQRLQLKRMPNNTKENNTIRKQMKPEGFGNYWNTWESGNKSQEFPQKHPGLYFPQGVPETSSRKTISCLTNYLVHYKKYGKL